MAQCLALTLGGGGFDSRPVGPGGLDHQMIFEGDTAAANFTFFSCRQFFGFFDEISLVA